MIDHYPNGKPFTLQGPFRYRLRNMAHLFLSVAKISGRRVVQGPAFPGANLALEVGIEFFREAFLYAIRQNPTSEGRAYLDSIIFHAPVLDEVSTEFVEEGVQGVWFTPPRLTAERPILFFPGGGYLFNPISAAALHALISKATGRRVFALNYPLAPEHPFPAQLEVAQKCYWWMVERHGFSPSSIIVGGASAGGNLCLALLLTLRSQKQPMPGQTFLLSPWVDICNSGESMRCDESQDWICLEGSEICACKFCGYAAADHPLVSPIHADLNGLGPIYIQAGGSEIFIDMIREFHARAREQGSLVTLDVWDEMIHCFQAFAEDVPAGREALERLSQVISRQEIGSREIRTISAN